MDTVIYGEGNLDADEFATIVIDYRMSVPDSCETVIIWSDGCIRTKTPLSSLSPTNSTSLDDLAGLWTTTASIEYGSTAHTPCVINMYVCVCVTAAAQRYSAPVDVQYAHTQGLSALCV